MRCRTSSRLPSLLFVTASLWLLEDCFRGNAIYWSVSPCATLRIKLPPRSKLPQRLRGSTPNFDVRIKEDATRLGEDDFNQAVQTLKFAGFVVLRGESLFQDADLADAQGAANARLQRIQEKAASLGLQDCAPWLCRKRKTWHHDETSFRFCEGISYTPGRLDMPDLMDIPPFQQQPWRNNPFLLKVFKAIFGYSSKQSVMGALWNFPGSGDTFWHRDGPMDGLVAVTAAEDYPEDVGFIHVQPFTHKRGHVGFKSKSDVAPKLEDSQIIPVVLRRGETLMYLYDTKHAATPNVTPNLNRCLLYSVYGPQDSLNHKSWMSSIFSLSPDDISEELYR